MRAVIYARVSTKDQAREERVSIPDQIKWAKEEIEKNGWQLVKEPYIEPGISGEEEIENRPALSQLFRDALNKEFDVILFYHSSRLAREPDIGLRFIRLVGRQRIQVYIRNVPIQPVESEEFEYDKNYLQMFMNAFAFVADKKENIDRIERFRTGIEGRLQKGYAVKPPPYGYRVRHIIGEDGKVIDKIREIDPEEAQIVRKIFKLYLDGKSFFAIAKYLNRKGFRTRKGALWTSTSIGGIIKNPFYTGKICYNKEVVDKSQKGDTGRYKRIRNSSTQWRVVSGKHEPIINMKTFDRAQQICVKKVNKGRAVASKRLLSGLVKCGYCGYSMVSEGSWGGGYYVCGQHHQNGSCQRNGKFLVKKLEEIILDGLQSLCQNPALKEKLKSQQQEIETKQLEKEIFTNKKKLSQFETRKERLFYAYETGEITLNEFAKRRALLQQEQKEFENFVEEQVKNLNHLKSLQHSRMNFDRILSEFVKSFKKLDLSKKKQLLFELIEKITITEDHIHVDYRILQ